jgi:hypothetical protein
MILQPEFLIDGVVPEISRMRSIKINNVFAIFEERWICRSGRTKDDANEPPFANVKANLCLDEEQFVGAVDDALGKYSCQRSHWNGA